MRIPFPHEDYEWQPVSKSGLIAWTIFFVLYMVHVFRAPLHGAGHFLQPVFFVVHEAGHLLFSHLGSEFLTIAGGTIFQFLVPLMLAAGFAWRGHTTGTAFCLFFMFTNCFDTAIYMADARAMDLPLLSVGGGGDEGVAHDWWNIFNTLGLLEQDQKIAAATRVIGWIGLVGSALWLAYMRQKHPATDDIFFREASA